MPGKDGVAFNTGALDVFIVNGASGGTSSADEAAFAAGVTSGTPLMGVVNPADTPPNGDLAVVALDGSRNLKVAGSFSSTPVSSNTEPTHGPTTVGTAAVQLLAANANRKALMLQNVGTTRIWILFGAGTPSSSNYDLALPACGVANDGSSLPAQIPILWKGAVQAIGSSPGGSVQAVEFT